MSALKQKLERLKQDFPFIDVDYNLLVLNNYEESRWITPTNVDNDLFAYDALNELQEFNLVCKKITPIYDNNGTLKGTRIDFLYRHDLNYKNIL